MSVQKPKLAVLCLAGGMILAAGCSSYRPDALDEARSNLDSAQQDKQLSTLAQLPLYEAARNYERAEKAWKDGASRKEVDHLAYLVNQQIEIAHQMAQQKSAEAEAQRMAGERERVILEARTREAEQARRLAEARGREADAARQQAQLSNDEAVNKAREAEVLRQQSETRMREIELARKQADDAAAQNARLEQQLIELKAGQTARGLELTLSNVLFDFDKATLKPGAERALNVLVDFLKDNPDRRLTIEGHTDSLGADSYNLQLSQERAKAVRNWFVQHNISGERIVAQGMGKNYPVASNDSEAGRQENRRVQIIISTPPERSAATATWR
jgi:outer membrane protein OmpA-like peptidoglycan-associated protein